MTRRICFVFLFLTFSACDSRNSAGPSIVLETTAGRGSPGLHASSWIEPDSARPAAAETDHVRAVLAGILAGQAEFRPTTAATPNFGYVREAVWLRFDVRNPGDRPARRLLEIGYPLLDSVHVFLLDARDAEPQLAGRAGRLFGMAGRHAAAQRNFAFSIEFPPRSTRTVYLRVHSKDSLNVPLALRSPEDFHAHTMNTRFSLGLYYGLIAVTLIYNIFLFVSVRDLSFLYYAATLVTLHGLFQLSLNGLLSEFAFAWFGLESLWIAREATAFFFSVAIFVSLAFATAFLNLRLITPRLHAFVRAAMVAALLTAALAFTGIDYFYLIRVAVLLGMGTVVLIIAAGMYALRAGHRFARFYLLAWYTLSFGGLLYALKVWGLLPSTTITEYGFQAGTAAEAIFLSLAVGDRYNELRRQTLAAREAALEQERLANAHQAELIHHLRNSETIKDELLALDAGDNEATDTNNSDANDAGAIDVLLHRILDTLRRLLDFERGFIIIADRENRAHSAGDFPDSLRAVISGEAFVARFLRAPEDLFPYLNTVILLETYSGQPFDHAPELKEKYASTIETIYGVIDALKEHGFQLCAPLSFRKEIFGYLVLGPRRGGLFYETSEIMLLESFRFSLALAIRNAVLFEEIRRLKGRAEAKIHRLSEYLSGMGEVIKHRSVGDNKSLVYASEAMARIYEDARRYGTRSQPVLISGQTGTGKELVARTFHGASGESDAPFVAINCAAVPASLWESEIFGHERGAFTDAKKSHAGRVEQAAGGTLFFDEIGEMPLEIQPKLLRLLQERRFQRLGGDKVIEARCRFVFATNRDLFVEQGQGRFREDLYYRISVLELKVPALRDRAEDIPALVHHFIEKYAGELGEPVSGIDHRALDTLCSYTWPGNIRELENTIIHALIHAGTETLRVEDLPRQLQQPNFGGVSRAPEVSPELSIHQKSFDDLVRDYSKLIIEEALSASNGNKQKAARLLGIKRATFYNKLKDLEIP